MVIKKESFSKQILSFHCYSNQNVICIKIKLPMQKQVSVMDSVELVFSLTNIKPDDTMVTHMARPSAAILWTIYLGSKNISKVYLGRVYMYQQ